MSTKRLTDDIKQQKQRWDYVPWEALSEIVDVLTFGGNKHSPHGWKEDNDSEDDFAGMMRHITEGRLGATSDPETGKHPFAHAACRLLFMLARELEV